MIIWKMPAALATPRNPRVSVDSEYINCSIKCPFDLKKLRTQGARHWYYKSHLLSFYLYIYLFFKKMIIKSANFGFIVCSRVIRKAHGSLHFGSLGLHQFIVIINSERTRQLWCIFTKSLQSLQIFLSYRQHTHC